MPRERFYEISALPDDARCIPQVRANGGNAISCSLGFGSERARSINCGEKMSEIVFNEAGIVVQTSLIKSGLTSFKVREIKSVRLLTYRTDSFTAPLAWIFAFGMFVIWAPGPIQNAFMIPLIIGFAAFAYWKQTHRKPARHRVIVNTGNLGGGTLLDTDDEDQSLRLHAAIESVMAATDTPSSASQGEGS
jgi:hypothetical protein